MRARHATYSGIGDLNIDDVPNVPEIIYNSPNGDFTQNSQDSSPELSTIEGSHVQARDQDPSSRSRSKDFTNESQRATRSVSNIDSTDSDLISSLYHTIEKLKNENETLQRPAVPFPPLRWQVLHRVVCNADKTTDIFLDVPSLLSAGGQETHLLGRVRINDVELYCERHPDIVFIIYRDYVCDSHDGRLRNNQANLDRNKDPVADIAEEAPRSGESLLIVSQVLCGALNNIVDDDPGRRKQYPEFDLYSEIPGPYLFYYNDRAAFKRKVARVRKDYRSQLSLFIAYIDESFGKEYGEVDESFNQGLVSAKHAEYLFTPDTLLISSTKDQAIAYVLESWPQWESIPPSGQMEQPTLHGILEVSSWEFDGAFEKMTTTLTITPSVDIKPIQDLNIYPLQYAEPEVEKLLRDRGRKFWQCRFQNYVCYSSSDVPREEDRVCL